MSETGVQYDGIAVGYARWWAPVLRPAVLELLDRVRPMLHGDERILDLGTGTGQLALAALDRWPSVRMTGVDVSADMLAVAGTEADRRLAPSDRARYETVEASARALPFADEAFDAVLSSFVIQLVDDRPRVLRQARRVLRPGGTLAYVAWLDGPDRFRPDEIFDEVVESLGLEPPGFDGGSGDIPSVERAANELRRAGFAGVQAAAGLVEHAYTVETYVPFLTEFDMSTFFEDLEAGLREDLLGRLRARLARLSPSEMTLRLPIVFAGGRRSR